MKPDPWVLEIYLNHRSALVDYAAPIVGCRARAEDVVQDAFLRYSAQQAAGTAAGTADGTADGTSNPGQAIAHPVSYLYRIVRNLALDGVRRSAVSGESADETTLARLPTATATPEQTTLDRDRLRLLAEALTELPERTRIAFDMHRIEGRSLQEVADRLGVSVVRAHQLVKDALRHASLRLDDDDRESNRLPGKPTGGKP